MRCRKIYVDPNGKKTVVWFGSVGLQDYGFDTAKWNTATWDEQSQGAKFIQDRQNYDEKSAAVASSLTQRLSVIRGELWYNMSYGLPLFEKNKSKVEFDTFILSTISQHSDVVSVKSFKSTLLNHEYSCKIEIESKYGRVTIEI